MDAPGRYHVPSIAMGKYVPRNGSTSSMALPPTGEPLVEDFQTRYMMPAKTKRLSDPPIAMTISAPDEDLPATLDFSSDADEEEAPAPPAFSNRRIVVPARSSNRNAPRRSKDNISYATASSATTTPDSRERTSTESAASRLTSATSIHTLPPLQNKGLPDEADRLQPLLEDDPANFDLVGAAPEQNRPLYDMEDRADELFSSAHLEMIFSQPKYLLNFTSYLNSFRPQSIPILIFYLDALKALRAITYANAIAEALDPIHGLDFTSQPPVPTKNQSLQDKADRAFEVLVREDLPAYIAHTWIQVVSTSIQRRITGTLAPHLREASEGLAEVFCLSDPSRKDNPIVFASEEFHRTTQYGMSYSIGRNCRFLQGPRTGKDSVRRLAEACKTSREHCELFVNYRRDGSPFMNLLMIAPLYDSKGTLRYFIGAQVDVSGLLKDCTNLETLERLVARNRGVADEQKPEQKDELMSLSEMFNANELETVRNHGGHMHKDQVDESDRESVLHRPRLLLKDASSDAVDTTGRSANVSNTPGLRLNGKLEGVYQHYLLVRPAPSLRILFTSPSLRVPGILQSPFLSRIGGSSRVRADLAQAMAEGQGVTAKIRWLTRPDNDGDGEGRSRWIHCTPLLGHGGTVGVWMIVLVDEEGIGAGEGKRRFRSAPPVANVIGGKEFDARATSEKRERERLRAERILRQDVPPMPYRHAYGDSSRTRTHTSRSIYEPERSGSVASNVVSTREGGTSEFSFQLQ